LAVDPVFPLLQQALERVTAFQGWGRPWTSNYLRLPRCERRLAIVASCDRG